MLLLVFFLSHVDDSRDKVLKLAPLKQLLSKVNLNLPTQRTRLFVFNETPRYDLRGFRGMETRIFVSAQLARALVSAHMFGRVCVDVHVHECSTSGCNERYK